MIGEDLRIAQKNAERAALGRKRGNQYVVEENGKLVPKDLSWRDIARLRIKMRAGQIVTQVRKCAMGEIDMTAQQFASCKLILDKCIPSLSAQQIQVVDSRDELSALPISELMRRLEDVLTGKPGATIDGIAVPSVGDDDDADDDSECLNINQSGDKITK